MWCSVLYGARGVCERSSVSVSVSVCNCAAVMVAGSAYCMRANERLVVLFLLVDAPEFGADHRSHRTKVVEAFAVGL